MNAARRCFVISPIGGEGSPVRQHADDVFDFIIKPAAERFGIVARRSDHLYEPGRISDQMFREIAASDCCLCVLTGHNPNVFYELAVAQAAGTPVIILIEKQEELPFDIKDLRCVRYDLSPRALFDGRYTKEIIAHLQSLEEASWIVPPLLSDADFLRRRLLGLPDSLITELSMPFDQKREALSNKQKQILFEIESLCRSKGSATQFELAGVFGIRPDEPEFYFRIEQLRLLGFIEKRRDDATHSFVYTLSRLYENLPGAAPAPPDSGGGPHDS